MTTATDANFEKFQNLLRELFQFDSADLDFGIYRIMNHKREAIERFISEDLPQTVSAELDGGNQREQTQATENLEKLAQQIVDVISPDAIAPDGNLDPAYHNSILGKRYLDARDAAAGARSQPVVESDVYNHLYAFFSRYYQDGDFISRRRYSHNQRYAIPYNGEEVYLHWANSDQYYVKTAEHFRNYDWTAPNGVTVRFRVQDANIEQNNVKGDTRFFVPRAADVDWDADARELTVPFDYRPLTGAEAGRYGRSGNRRDKITAAAASSIPNALTDAPEALDALTGEHRRNGNDESVSRLEHHLRRYTRRNDSDFFIHKDLSGFLNRELDFYLKNEVLNLDEISTAGPDMAQGWFQEMAVIKTVGGQIIDFVSQIEAFQKTLWEKRKFVTDAQYCVTLANAPSDFYPEIAANAAQWDEWQTLFGIDGADRSDAFLDAHPTLPLDTVHFGIEFTDRLIASFDDLDRMTDGVLVHSDNWQALSLLGEKYRSDVDCIYIDPPYNTGDSQILYKNGYLYSSWLTLMSNRLQVATRFLSNDPTLFVAIDDFEMVDLCKLIDSHFPWRREMIIVNHHPQGGKAQTLSTTHEYMITCVSQASTRALVGHTKNNGVERRPFQRAGTAESNFRYARPNSFYAILLHPETYAVVGLEPPPERGVSDYPTGPNEDGNLRVYPISKNGEERVWRNAYQSCQTLLTQGKLESTVNQTIYQLIDESDRRAALFSNWTDTRYNAGTHGANLLGDILGERNAFPYPKSVHTVGDAIFATKMASGAYCLDYFAGSGTTAHAVINLNREDGGGRKFILVEMGEYFDTVILPRVKKVIYTPEWANGLPKRDATPEEAERSPRIVKYLRLESYEDALDGIAFDENSSQLALDSFGDEYLLKYMLKWETKDSHTLLNARDLTAPFSYILRARSNGADRDLEADIPETFNYLIGLNVQKREAHRDGDNRYLVFRGETRDAPGRVVVAIWRDTEGWTEDDFVRDRDFVAERRFTEDADTIYVNGLSIIPGAKAVEPIFKARMFAGVTD